MQTAESTTMESASPSETTPTIEIRALKAGEDATAFRTLNEEWITHHFGLEQKDIETLGDPQTAILDKGGQIFIVFGGDEPVGCVALIPMQHGVYELSKMAVSPSMRGLGVGRRLLEYAVAQARTLGAKSLFLGSSTKLKNAVHLYESIGFRHVDPASLPEMHYSRADVFMEMPL
jgi:putative acetyltransferase